MLEKYSKRGRIGKKKKKKETVRCPPHSSYRVSERSPRSSEVALLTATTWGPVWCSNTTPQREALFLSDKQPARCCTHHGELHRSDPRSSIPSFYKYTLIYIAFHVDVYRPLILYKYKVNILISETYTCLHLLVNKITYIM